MAGQEEHKEGGHGDAHGDAHGGGGGHKKHGGHGHGGGHEEHEEGVPEWVVSFADNALLQMGFFAILLAMNMGPKGGGETTDGSKDSPDGSFLDAMISLREAFNGKPINPGDARPDEMMLYRRQQEKRESGEADQKGPKGDNPNLQSQGPTELANINGTVPFDEGSADLVPSARAVAVDVAKNLRGQRWIIEVRGHTDGIEASDGPDSAMGLAYQRALRVGATLVEAGLQWNQLRIVACADNERRNAMANDRPAHATNRRVDIVVTRDTIAADPHLREPGR